MNKGYMKLETMTKEHYKDIYDIAISSEPWTTGMTLEQFTAPMQKREGYVLIHKDKVIGCVSFSDYTPLSSILIHATIDTKYQGKWATKNILKQIFQYVFEILELPRLSGISIVGMSDKAGEFLLRLGFKEEGCIRKGMRLTNGYYDLKMFGMLKEECKFI